MEPGSWRGGLTSGQRGYGYRWQVERAAYLRLHPLCVKCLDESPDTAQMGTVVDHRVPHRGDMALFWDKSNWQTLCLTHHNRDKQREENGLGP